MRLIILPSWTYFSCHIPVMKSSWAEKPLVANINWGWSFGQWVAFLERNAAGISICGLVSYMEGSNGKKRDLHESSWTAIQRLKPARAEAYVRVMSEPLTRGKHTYVISSYGSEGFFSLNLQWELVRNASQFSLNHLIQRVCNEYMTDQYEMGKIWTCFYHSVSWQNSSAFATSRIVQDPFDQIYFIYASQDLCVYLSDQTTLRATYSLKSSWKYVHSFFDLITDGSSTTTMRIGSCWQCPTFLKTWTRRACRLTDHGF